MPVPDGWLLLLGDPCQLQVPPLLPLRGLAAVAATTASVAVTAAIADAGPTIANHVGFIVQKHRGAVEAGPAWRELHHCMQRQWTRLLGFSLGIML